MTYPEGLPRNYGVMPGRINEPDDTVIVRLSRNLRRSPRLAQLYGSSFEQIDRGVFKLGQVDLEQGIVTLTTRVRENDVVRVAIGEGMDRFNSRRSKGEHLQHPANPTATLNPKNTDATQADDNTTPQSA